MQRDTEREKGKFFRSASIDQPPIHGGGKFSGDRHHFFRRQRMMESGSSNYESGISNRCSNDFWTNERHLDFLNLIETRFVRNVLEGKRSTTNCGRNHHQHHRLAAVGLIHHHNSSKKIHNNRLDRFVPDISESTLDLQTRKTNYSGSVAVTNPVHRIRSRQRERRQAHPWKISHDQVVPQLLDEKTGDKDEEDHHNH